MAKFSAELGCVDAEKIQRADLQTTEYANGIMFVWRPQGGCFSGLGIQRKVINSWKYKFVLTNVFL